MKHWCCENSKGQLRVCTLTCLNNCKINMSNPLTCKILNSYAEEDEITEAQRIVESRRQTGNSLFNIYKKPKATAKKESKDYDKEVVIHAIAKWVNKIKELNRRLGLMPSGKPKEIYTNEEQRLSKRLRNRKLSGSTVRSTRQQRPEEGDRLSNQPAGTPCNQVEESFPMLPY
jgi:hypothetical protein